MPELFTPCLNKVTPPSRPHRPEYSPSDNATTSLATELPPFQMALGPGIIPTGLPVLGGVVIEHLFPSARPAGRQGRLTLFRMNGWVLGAATIPLLPSLEEASHQLYLDIFSALGTNHLARIWNYVPAINRPGSAGLENYRSFCQGRSLAFEHHYGSGFRAHLPAGTAVGCQSSALTVAFAASPVAPRHVENPLQISACDYPREYGPRPPSFARATVVPTDDSRFVFVSGTAAIRGHGTVAPHDTREQLECTLENLRSISRACDVGDSLDAGGRSQRHFKVYLRHPADLPAVSATLCERLLQTGDNVSYLHANICRSELNVEIEVSLCPAAPRGMNH